MVVVNPMASNKDERWQVPYRIIQSKNLYHIQLEMGKDWKTLSEMQNNGHSYHFVKYRSWTDMKDIVKWWKTVQRSKILNTNVWMPSKALYDIVVVSDYNQIIEDYPELII